MIDFIKYLIAQTLLFSKEKEKDIFFGLPNKEKQKILREVVRKSNKMQTDILREFDKKKDSGTCATT